MKHYILNNKDEVIETTIEEWGKWMTPKNCVVKRDTVSTFLITTTFTGIEANDDHIPPRVWDTISWKIQGMKLHLHTRCIGTRQDALLQHAAMMEIITKSL